MVLVFYSWLVPKRWGKRWEKNLVCYKWNQIRDLMLRNICSKHSAMVFTLFSCLIVIILCDFYKTRHVEKLISYITSTRKIQQYTYLICSSLVKILVTFSAGSTCNQTRFALKHMHVSKSVEWTVIWKHLQPSRCYSQYPCLLLLNFFFFLIASRSGETFFTYSVFLWYYSNCI